MTPIIQAEHIMKDEHGRLPHDAKYADGVAFTQGQYRPIAEGVVPIQDMGFIHADAAYDVVSASGGYIFRMEDHLKRFNQSCEKFLLQNPYSDEETEEILTNMVKLAGLKDAYIWWAVTRGQMSSDRSSMEFSNQFYAFVTPYMFIQDDVARTSGINLQISDQFLRISDKAVDPTAKNFHWMDMKLALIGALVGGADWAVLIDEAGNLTEATGSNIFLIKDGVVKTPDNGCLEGITRLTTMELAKEIGLKVEACTIPASALAEADEVFMTSTAGGIMPVAQVNGQALKGQNGPGPLTSKLHDLYWTKRWDGWKGTEIDFSSPANV